MDIELEIWVNKYGQSIIEIGQLIEKFNALSLHQKRLFLKNILSLIVQSKPNNADIEQAIEQSKLKETFTPCILLRKGVEEYHLQKIVDLPEPELNKAFILLLSLFKIAYKRRFEIEKNAPNKWWYGDLSDETKNQEIVQKHRSPWSNNSN